MDDSSRFVFETSPADALLEMRRVASAFHGDIGDGIADLSKIFGGQFNFSRADILLKPMQLRGSGNRDDPRLLSQQPRKRDLCRGYFLPGCDFSKYIHQRLVRPSGPPA